MAEENQMELAKQQCIFCHIVANRVASKKVYEDEKVLAILDINPANPGHVLLLPKEHVPVMPLLPDDLIAHLGMVAKQLSQAVLRALKAQGTNIFIANGAVAGQRAPHFMMHVIPRMENDGVGLMLPEMKIDEKAYKALHERLVPFVARQFGKEVTEFKRESKEQEAKEEPKEKKQETREPKPKKEESEEKKEEKPKVKPASKLDEIAEFLAGGS